MDFFNGKSAQLSAFYVRLMLGTIWVGKRTLLFGQLLKRKAIALLSRDYLRLGQRRLGTAGMVLVD